MSLQEDPSSSDDPRTSDSQPGAVESGTPLIPLQDFQSSLRFRRRLDALAEKLILGISIAAISIIFLIFVYIAREAWPLIIGSAREASLSGILGMPFQWQPVSTMPRFSVAPLLVGTIKVTVVAMAFATPLALAAALYTAEFASPRLREWVKPTIELLAGIPSVVVGFFVLIVLASWLQDTLGLPFRLNALTAGIGLSLAVIPIIFTVAEDALSAVPRTYKEASLALGASRVETAIRVVLPAASPGIGAALILGFGRAIGETMIVLMVSGNAALMAFDPLTPARTMSATIAAELGEVVFGGDHYRVLFFIGVLLFILTSGLNWVGDRINRGLRQKLFGGV